MTAVLIKGDCMADLNTKLNDYLATIDESKVFGVEMVCNGNLYSATVLILN